MFFENIDNNYIVIGLIVLTLVCIYLLYSNLSSGGDSIELKKHINELVLQNKKRDEIIHFLVNQVQLLQSQPPMTEITTSTNESNVNIPTTTATHVETVNISDINNEEMAKLDEILNEDFSTTEVNIEEDNTTKPNIEKITEKTLSEDNTKEVETDDGLVDSVLSTDKLPPKDKDLLYVYTVSQLKDYAKDLNVSTSGTKDVLINRIFDAL
jgi:hypothetical protein